LLGTALASTLILGSLLKPAPALAAECAFPIGGGPINSSTTTPNTPLICVNPEARSGGPYAIQLTTTGANSYIYFNNSGASERRHLCRHIQWQ
jgi:hypothetical protein